MCIRVFLMLFASLLQGVCGALILFAGGLRGEGAGGKSLIVNPEDPKEAMCRGG